MKINPDKEFVAEMRKAIKANNGYCPCELTKTPDTKCPCKAKRTKNECHCGLYVSESEGENNG